MSVRLNEQGLKLAGRQVENNWLSRRLSSMRIPQGEWQLQSDGTALLDLRIYGNARMVSRNTKCRRWMSVEQGTNVIRHPVGTVALGILNLTAEIPQTKVE